MAHQQILEHMTSIRDGLHKVCLITSELGAQPQQEALETALSMRENLLFTEVEKNERELSAAFPDWRAQVNGDADLKDLLGETEALVHSIARMDEAIALTLQRRMSGVKAKLSSLYQTSRAACSYTTQSKLRAG